MKTWKNRAQKLLIIHNWNFLGSFVRTAHMAENWFPILEIRVRHPLFYLLCAWNPIEPSWIVLTRVTRICELGKTTLREIRSSENIFN